MCEQLGKEPDPKEMPLSIPDFAPEVQVAFFMCSLLPDRWDGASGSYLGKDWSSIGYLLDTYGVQYPTSIIHLMKLYENEIISYRAQKQQKQVEREKRKAQAQGGGNKKFTHNIRG